MANYIARFKTSVFPVNNVAEFSAEMDYIKEYGDCEEFEYGFEDEDEGLAYVYGCGGIPGHTFNDEKDEDYVEIDFFEIIQKHLTEDGCCTITEIGYEKFRYLTAVCLDIRKNDIVETIASVSHAITDKPPRRVWFHK